MKTLFGVHAQVSLRAKRTNPRTSPSSDQPVPVAVASEQSAGEPPYRFGLAVLAAFDGAVCLRWVVVWFSVRGAGSGISSGSHSAGSRLTT